ncbi:MAG: hypothetical protein ACP5QT_09195 [Brevinematia bacterium]
MKKKILLILMTIYGMLNCLEREKELSLPAEIMGAGGTGIVAYDKFGMVFMNPASFGVTSKSYFSFVRNGIRFNYDLYEYYTIYEKMRGNTDIYAILPEIAPILSKLNVCAGVNGPLAFGYMTEGIGFLIYNDFNTSLSSHFSGILPYLDASIYSDLVFLSGFGKKFDIPFYFGKNVTTYAGINVKYINRLKYQNPHLSLLEAFDLFASGFKEGFLWGQAIGSDLGILFKGEYICVGFVVKNWFNTYFSWSAYDTNFQYISNRTIEPTYYPASFNLGLSYRLKNFFLKYGIKDWTFYFDLSDAFYFEENYLLKLKFGTEVTFLSILKARAGLYKGYPTLGFGIEIPFLHINFAYYTEELSKLPGYKPQQNFLLEFHALL